MKAGDIVMVFLDAVNSRYPQGQARLIRWIDSYNEILELWEVEYLDYSQKTFQVFLKKPNEQIKTNGKTKSKTF